MAKNMEYKPGKGINFTEANSAVPEPSGETEASGQKAKAGRRIGGLAMAGVAAALGMAGCGPAHDTTPGEKVSDTVKDATGAIKEARKALATSAEELKAEAQLRKDRAEAARKAGEWIGNNAPYFKDGDPEAQRDALVLKLLQEIPVDVLASLPNGDKSLTHAVAKAMEALRAGKSPEEIRGIAATAAMDDRNFIFSTLDSIDRSLSDSGVREKNAEKERAILWEEFERGVGRGIRTPATIALGTGGRFDILAERAARGRALGSTPPEVYRFELTVTLTGDDWEKATGIPIPRGSWRQAQVGNLRFPSSVPPKKRQVNLYWKIHDFDNPDNDLWVEQPYAEGDEAESFNSRAKRQLGAAGPRGAALWQSYEKGKAWPAEVKVVGPAGTKFTFIMDTPPKEWTWK